MYGVLIVDDEVIERKYLKSVINKYSSQYYVAGETSNGKEAIQIAFNKNPAVIIMDISIPLIDGLQASKVIKSKFPNTIIILNSAYSNFEFAQTAIQYDLDAYLLKPSSEKDIIETIESTLQKNKYYGKNKLYHNSKNLTNIWDYPYSTVDKLVDSILVKDTEMLKQNINDYLNHLKSIVGNVDEYRLFIINSIFILIKTLKDILMEDDLYILKCEKYLNIIGHAKYWHEIYYYMNEFLELMLSMLSKNYFYNFSISDSLENYIDDNYQNNITLEELAETFNYSCSYLSKKFHEDKGYTISDYIKEKKIDHSMYLLKNSKIPIKDIASMAGFTSISHFNRVFKSTTGLTPSEYRKKETRKK